MDFSAKYNPPKRTDFGPYPEQSFGEVAWTWAFFPCHNWPCQKLTGWVAYVEGESGITRDYVCSEECLHELANGCKIQTVQAAPVEPEPRYERICVPMVVVPPTPDANVVQATTEVRAVEPVEPPPLPERQREQAEAWLLDGEPVSGVLAWDRNPPVTKPLSSFKMDDTLKKLLGKT